jgi:GNAT superfamily N-acetyltransferase
MEVARSMRIATEDDFLAASEIRKLVLPASHGYEYENNIRCVGTFNAVAVIEGKVVGFVSALTDNAPRVPDAPAKDDHLWKFLRPYIAFVGVRPDYQGQRIGSSLLIWVCDSIFLFAECQSIYLECTEEHRSTYARAGFQLVPADEIERQFHQRPKALVLLKQRP